MSLTSRLKSAGIKRHTARDGTTYVLQRVNDANPFLESGLFPAILDMIEGDKNPKDLTSAEVLRKLRQNPKHAEEAVRLGTRARIHKLEHGLVGELDQHGALQRYAFVDKPLYDLSEGEVNARAIPTELADELIEAIDALGRPAVEAQAIARFPEDRSGAGASATLERDRGAPQRGPVGPSGAH